MKLCFFGVGGVGGYFGTLLSEKIKDIHDVYFIARGVHKEAILSNGLTLKKTGGKEVVNVKPTLCTDNAEELPVCDIIILSVKSYDLINAVQQIAKISDKNTVILPLLNGVDIYDRIRKHLKTGIVLRSCVYVGTHIESPGVIYQKGGSCRVSIGKDPSHSEFYPEKLLALLKISGIDYTWEDVITKAIWSKYIFIAAYGLVTSAYEKSLGQVVENSELSQITKAIMSEIEQIAKGLNVELSSDIVEISFQKATQFPFETKTSFQRDIEMKGKINEGDLFGETLIRYGKELRIPTPNTEKVYKKLVDSI